MYYARRDFAKANESALDFSASVYIYVSMHTIALSCTRGLVDTGAFACVLYVWEERERKRVRAGDERVCVCTG